MKILPTAVANKFGPQLLKVKVASPQLMFAGGIVAGGAGVVMACRATLKVSDTLDKYDELKEKAANALEHKFVGDDGEEYNEKAFAKDMTVIKVKTILDLTKLYAPAAGLLMLSAGLLTGSHVTLNRRNASALAAYAATDEAFKKYRDRVRDQLGKDVDDEMRHGTRVVEEKVQTDDGKTKTVKKKLVGDGAPSQYARFFDELCGPHHHDPELNRIFLQSQQSYFNDLLQVKGYVFLNEVYRALDLPETKAGQIVGWMLGKGDNYVDFGIFDNVANPEVRDFVNGREYSILLDFNVDGIILDHMKDN
jgi:hypothetical protein